MSRRDRQRVQIAGKGQDGHVSDRIVLHPGGKERDIVGVFDGITRENQAVKVRVFGGPLSRFASGIVFDEQVVVVEIYDDLIACLLQNLVCGIRRIGNARNGLGNDRENLRGQLQRKADHHIRPVVHPVVRQISERLAASIAQRGDSTQRIVDPVQLDAVQIVRQALRQADNNLILIGR